MYGYCYSAYNRLSFLGGFDSNASAFFVATGITDPVIQSAINTLCVDLKKYGVFDKMKAIYPFVGGTATTHKFNLKDPRDLDVAFRLQFNGGWTHSNTGAKGNGVNNYATTYFNPSVSAVAGINVGFYTRTSFSSSSAYPIAYTAVTTPNFNYTGGIQWQDSYMGTVATNIQNQSGYLGFFQRAGTTGIQTRRLNLLSKGSNSQNYAPANSVIDIATSSSGFTNNCEYAFFTIGDYLTTTEQDNLYTSVQKFQTSLSRQV